MKYRNPGPRTAIKTTSQLGKRNNASPHQKKEPVWLGNTPHSTSLYKKRLLRIALLGYSRKIEIGGRGWRTWNFQGY